MEKGCQFETNQHKNNIYFTQQDELIKPNETSSKQNKASKLEYLHELNSSLEI